MHYSVIAILHNPKSTGDSKANAKKLKADLEAKGLTNVILQATTHAGHAEELAYDLSMRSSQPLIISSSGDGGYNEVINGALRAQAQGAHPTTCVIPSGNANDHFNQLHHGDTAERIIKGHRQHIDVLHVTADSADYHFSRYAHSYIGFGVTPEIGKELNAAELNATNEIAISIKSLLKSKPFAISEQGKKQEYQSIVFSNVAKMAKVLGLAKDSAVDDGLFEVFALPPSKAFLLVLIVKSATVGIRYTKQTDHYDFRTIQKQAVQCDGEIFDIKGKAKVRVGIEQKVLACIV